MSDHRAFLIGAQAPHFFAHAALAQQRRRVDCNAYRAAHDTGECVQVFFGADRTVHLAILKRALFHKAFLVTGRSGVDRFNAVPASACGTSSRVNRFLFFHIRMLFYLAIERYSAYT